MARTVGARNRIKKPDFVLAYEKARRATGTDPIKVMWATMQGENLDGTPNPAITNDLKYKAAKDLVYMRFPVNSVAAYDEAKRQKDMFESQDGQVLGFGVQNASNT